MIRIWFENALHSTYQCVCLVFVVSSVYISVRILNRDRVNFWSQGKFWILDILSERACT